jgi:Asp-tRNA(Asn)/Glu-tRNA(Gln) amidotransferase A subunit family amidase
VPLALGTQTIGSINRPAAFCGVVGYKPSYERISRSGVIPLSASFDHVGLIAQDVPCAALAASVLGKQWQAPSSGGRRPTLGIPKGPYLQHASTAGLAQFERDWRALAEVGYAIKTVEVLTNFDEIVARHRALMAAEAARFHAKWYKQHANLYHAETVALIEEGRKIPAEIVRTSREGRERVRHTLLAAMAHHDVDLLIAPAARGVAPSGLESTGDPIMNLPWTHAGLPTVNVPTGRDEDTGLPYSMQLVGRWYEDEKLLAWAADIGDIVGTAKSEG